MGNGNGSNGLPPRFKKILGVAVSALLAIQLFSLTALDTVEKVATRSRDAIGAVRGDVAEVGKAVTSGVEEITDGIGGVAATLDGVAGQVTGAEDQAQTDLLRQLQAQVEELMRLVETPRGESFPVLDPPMTTVPAPTSPSARPPPTTTTTTATTRPPPGAPPEPPRPPPPEKCRLRLLGFCLVPLPLEEPHP